MRFFLRASRISHIHRSLVISPIFLVAALLFVDTARTVAQSTFGSILGVVQDSSGAVVAGATITLINTGTTAQRVAKTDNAGEFTFSNIDVGTYTVTIAASGFEKFSQPDIVLTARESRRIEAKLQPGAESQTMTVTAEAQNIIQTEVSNLAETKLGEELVNLPVAVYSRSTGSTSPIATLTTEAGVQTDDSGNLSVMGAPAPLLSVTVDGISSVGVEYSGPINEMFPSFNSIEEIRVSESNNNAEFSGVADITTVSKAGTNQYHGGVFENHENTAFNAGDPFTGAKPKIIMNDFGGTLGGPIRIPHFYNGRDKSFFFISYEGLRLPRETPLISSVPTDAMRAGNVQDYLTQQYCTPPTVSSACYTDENGNAAYPVYNPDGTPITDETAVPVDATAAKLLTYLFPRQNYGGASTYANNYRVNFPAPISTNQGDVRIDQTLTSK
ncbi:MAG TPA: carboxypeptidase-like regulatory domain-containing protein, partial [Acidobacteriaceae bacterium]